MLSRKVLCAGEFVSRPEADDFQRLREDVCLQMLTSFSLTRAKLLVRVDGRSSFDLDMLDKSFTHGRISNAIFGRCRYSDFL